MVAAVLQRAEREPVLRGFRCVQEDSGLDPGAAVQAHLQLVRRQRYVEPGLEVGDLCGAHVGHAEAPYEALAVQGGQRGGDRVDVRQRVGAVQQEDVDHIGPQPGQALLDAPRDALPAQVVHPRAVLVAQSDPALGLEGDALAQPRCAREHLAEDGLGLPVPVDVGVVERGDPDVEGGGDGRLGGVDVRGPVRVGVPAPAQAHAPVQHPVAAQARTRVRHHPTLGSDGYLTACGGTRSGSHRARCTV